MKFGMGNSKIKLVICTTVPDTILYILKGQPKYLNQYFDVVIVTSYSEKCRNISDLENVRVYNVAFKRNINIFFDFVALIQMILLLSKLKPQIIHSYTPKAGLLSMLSSWILNVPVRIHTFTGLIFPNQNGFKKQLLILLDKIICLCSTKIIPEGRGVKNDLISYGITSKKLELIGCGNISGIDSNYYSETEIDHNDSLKKLGIKYDSIQNKFIYCFIGRLNVDKGLRELYEAFITLPQNTFLLIAGDLDKGGNSISLELYNKMKNNNRIILLGFVEDVRLVLKLSKILVLPSYREGFPNVLLQSLSMKVPAIATNINGCNEIIIDNHNGWLIEPNNFRDLADKMKFTLKIENNYFEKIKENTRESITSRFEQSEYRKLLLKEYYSLYKQ
jgi:glycosyltransferase involved in cell wall biosynthesis